MSARYDHLRSYLDVLTAGANAGELLELRYRLTGGDGLGRYFEPVGSAHALAARALMLARSTDTYIACAPRLRHRGTLGDVAAGAVVWADLDTPQAVERLERFSPAAAVVIASGTDTNVHAYWPLTERASAEDVASANRQLAHALGGDGGAVTNAAAILRPPGTRNHKHQPPTRVEALQLEPDRRLALEEITAGLNDPKPDEPDRRREHARRAPAGDDPLLAIAPADYVGRLLGVAVPRSGKVPCPFHEDRTPSLHVYDTPAEGWCCFSARCADGSRPRGGTIYDPAAGLPDHRQGLPGTQARAAAHLLPGCRLIAQHARAEGGATLNPWLANRSRSRSR